MEPESRPESQDRLSNGSLFRDPNGWQTVEPAAASTAVEEDEEEERPSRTRFLLPLGLLLLTVFTTLWAGAYQTNSNPFQGPWQFLRQDPSALWKGIPFAATLLGILVTHEFGHYLFSKIHRVPATLPLFIPGPPHFIGTFGAIIRMKPILNRKALFDIGVAGPIAGFLVALVMLAIGLKWSKVVTVDESFGLHLGEPLLLQFMSSLIIGDIPPRADVILHPVGFAAWFGLFGPAGLSPEVTARLHDAAAAAVRSDAFKQRLENDGATPKSMSPEAFAKFVEEDVARWAEVIRFSGATVE